MPHKHQTKSVKNLPQSKQLSDKPNCYTCNLMNSLLVEDFVWKFDRKIILIEWKKEKQKLLSYINCEDAIEGITRRKITILAKTAMLLSVIIIANLIYDKIHFSHSPPLPVLKWCSIDLQ